MVYSENMLNTEWMPQIRWPNGQDVTLMVVQKAIQAQADENGIAVAFRNETLKVGGLFSKEREDILIMYNPEHAMDYLYFAIRIKHQGKYAFMHIYNMGGSKNFKNDNSANFDSLGGMSRMVINSLGGHKKKLEEEENYYTILRDCLENIIG